MIDAGHLERIAVETAEEAAARIRTSVDLVPVATKSTDSDVVTATDLAAEKLIIERLGVATPGARILAEEQGHGIVGPGLGPEDEQAEQQRIEWVVDPLDGTVNFTYGIPFTSVSLAAVVDGQTAAGAVVDVGSGEVFSARRGGGARRNGHPIRCNHPEGLDRCLLVTGYSYSADQRQAHGRLMAELLGRVRDIRAFGSAALQWCWVASGRVDAYLERDTKPWDYAAGSLVAAEAGAAVELPCPENDGLALAIHPDRFAELRSLV